MSLRRVLDVLALALALHLAFWLVTGLTLTAPIYPERFESFGRGFILAILHVAAIVWLFVRTAERLSD